MNRDEVVKELTLGSLDDALITLYGNHEETLAAQRKRYIKAIRSFETIYPESEDISIFSAPGRSEICGNHTDHQHGCVLAAAIDLDAIAIVSFHNDHVIRLQSVGYEPDSAGWPSRPARPASW